MSVLGIEALHIIIFFWFLVCDIQPHSCDPNSTREQIIAEYRFRVRDLHPDKVPADQMIEASDKFMKLTR